MSELQFSEDELIVSKTDTKGHIIYGNELFLKLAGYTEKELIGTAHNLVRDPRMPKLVFKLLWETIQKGKEINAYVVNRAKNGDFYWVFANVTPSFDPDGNIVGYHSVRRKPSQKALDIIQPLYKKLVDVERQEGIEGSKKVLTQLLADKGETYENFILSI